MQRQIQQLPVNGRSPLLRCKALDQLSILGEGGDVLITKPLADVAVEQLECGASYEVDGE
jgi:hypothetical protein